MGEEVHRDALSTYEQRKELIAIELAHGIHVTKACRKYKVAPRSVYDWVQEKEFINKVLMIRLALMDEMHGMVMGLAGIAFARLRMLLCSEDERIALVAFSEWRQSVDIISRHPMIMKRLQDAEMEMMKLQDEIQSQIRVAREEKVKKKAAS